MLTVTKQLLSFHTLGLWGLTTKMRFMSNQWKRALTPAYTMHGMTLHEIIFVGIPQTLPPLIIFTTNLLQFHNKSLWIINPYALYYFSLFSADGHFRIHLSVCFMLLYAKNNR